MGALFSLIASIPLVVEAIGLILLGILILVVTRKQQLQNRLYTHEIPIFMVTAGVGALIPGGYALLLAVLYVCGRVFQEATYEICPPCWNRFGQLTKWFWRNTIGRI